MRVVLRDCPINSFIYFAMTQNTQGAKVALAVNNSVVESLIVVTPPQRYNPKKATTGQALGLVISRLAEDPEYAWAWHSSYAYTAYKHGMDNAAAQYAAAEWISMLTSGQVDMTKNKKYTAWFIEYNRTLKHKGIDKLKEELPGGAQDDEIPFETADRQPIKTDHRRPDHHNV